MSTGAFSGVTERNVLDEVLDPADRTLHTRGPVKIDGHETGPWEGHLDGHWTALIDGRSIRAASKEELAGKIANLLPGGVWTLHGRNDRCAKWAHFLNPSGAQRGNQTSRMEEQSQCVNRMSNDDIGVFDRVNRQALAAEYSDPDSRGF